MQRPLTILLPLLCALSSSAAAAPTVDVDLHTSFPAPPFFLELLESAATENASSYFPLLASVAAGRLETHGRTDEQSYTTFRRILQDDGHISDPHALASWDLAVATHASAPKVEAQFHFWRSIVERNSSHTERGHTPQKAIEAWCQDRQIRIEDRCKGVSTHPPRVLDFDRVYGDTSKSPPLTLYINPTSPGFRDEYTSWLQRHGQSGFILRYRPDATEHGEPLTVSGYGVELALKRTDYIVIDDRESGVAKEQERGPDFEQDIDLDGGDVADVKPLSSSELRNLGVNAANYIMSSDDPMDTLLKISQDFPKYSSALAQHNASKALLREHYANREIALRPGFNALWLNGQQISPREIDAYTLLDLLRRERKFINRLQTQGLRAADAIRLVSHPKLVSAQGSDDVQRYDFRDDAEGGNVIIWLNDLEKDKRYAEWPDTVNAYLQRMFPGQLPTVRKNAHTVIYPLDMSDAQEVFEVVDSLQNFVKRTVPIRFGIVPVVKDDATAAQAQTVYHLYDAYGLSAMMRYLQSSLQAQQLTNPYEKAFVTVTEGAKLRRGHQELSLSEVPRANELVSRASSAEQYIARLGSNDTKTPAFANGVPVVRDEAWMQTLSQRLTLDLRIIQQGVFEETIDDDTWLPGLYLNGSSQYRDPLLIPEDEKSVTLFDVAALSDKYQTVFDGTPYFQSSEATDSTHLTSLLVIADLNERSGADLVLHAAQFAELHPEVRLQIMQLPQTTEAKSQVTTDSIARMQDILDRDYPELTSPHKKRIALYLTEVLMKQQSSSNGSGDASSIELAHAFGLYAGDRAVIVNGRRIGPLAEGRTLTASDLAVALSYEQKKRAQPTLAAMEDLQVAPGLQDPFAVGRISTLLALSTVSDVPEGIYDNAPGPRTNIFDQWSTLETCIPLGDSAEAVLHVVATIDPSSDTAQRWLPILDVLSQLTGVHMKIFLNPRERLQELPTKRFYRHVLHHIPRFDQSGSVAKESARFSGIPENALLTMTMDVSPLWLVAPKQSVHDLDNLRLSSLKDYASISASYELESILIEGHSRDSATGAPPRGVQLVLSTEAGKEHAGTIVMANLGYFQFKANPGVYNLELKHGASDRIFTIESAGREGYAAQPGDDSTDILLTSFKGSTVFPRLARRPGMETEDVLEASSNTAADIIAKSAGFADDILAKAGLSNIQAGDYIARGFKWGQDVLGMSGMIPAPAPKQADINIFSVASGHLYERMLNIMMISVMRHTNHTVKFWFVEQFLSPSFKAFLPTVAQTYGFTYEMVTYKWPHWLRAQQEKQRTIWGYKILFLDVLFPLDLDKVIFVDADQIVRTDMYDLVQHNLEGAPYGFTPMCDSRTEMEGFRFWKQGYWENFLRGKPYHISALYVVDLKRFRQMAAGDRLRQQYHSLSADPGSLSNLDQDLPNHMQHNLPIHSLPQEWLWCETWCSDESLKDARTIDLCNNPQTKEPKLDRARRQVPEWTMYDNEIAAVAKRSEMASQLVDGVVGGSHIIGEQEQLQREAASKKDEL